MTTAKTNRARKPKRKTPPAKAAGGCVDYRLPDGTTITPTERNERLRRLRYAALMDSCYPFVRHAFDEFADVAETADRVAALLTAGSALAIKVNPSADDINLLRSLATIARLAVGLIGQAIPQDHEAEYPSDELIAEWQAVKHAERI